MKSALPDLNWFNLKGCWIAGGAVLSTVTKQEIADFDIYPKTRDAFIELIEQMMSEGVLINISENALTFKHNDRAFANENGERMLVQIVKGEYPSVKSIFEDFDFTIAMAAYDCDTGEYHYSDAFWPDVASRTIRFNPKTRYPLNSLMRIAKYQKRGYTFPKAQLLKLGLAVTQAGLPQSWEDLERQIGGTYGRNIKLTRTDREFSLDAMYDVLDELVFGQFDEYDNAETYQSCTFEDVLVLIGEYDEQLFHYDFQTSIWVNSLSKKLTTKKYLSKMPDGTFTLSTVNFNPNVQHLVDSQPLPDDALVRGWKALKRTDENTLVSPVWTQKQVQYSVTDVTSVDQKDPKGLFVFMDYAAAKNRARGTKGGEVYLVVTEAKNIRAIKHNEFQTHSLKLVEKVNDDDGVK